MRKVIYVEGVTEIIFVYHLICTHYSYNGRQCRIQITSLDRATKLSLPKDFGESNAPNFFLIVGAAGDEGVVSLIKERYSGHMREGYDVVVGLRDVYGQAYCKLAGHRIDRGKVKMLIEAQRKQLHDNLSASLCFAIMEIEAWLMGMDDYLKDKFPKLDLKWDKDPETTYVHPYNELHTVLNRIGVAFEKHGGDIMSFFDRITKDDFDKLYSSAKCSSFNEFYEVLFN